MTDSVEIASAPWPYSPNKTLKLLMEGAPDQRRYRLDLVYPNGRHAAGLKRFEMLPMSSISHAGRSFEMTLIFERERVEMEARKAARRKPA